MNQFINHQGDSRRQAKFRTSKTRRGFYDLTPKLTGNNLTVDIKQDGKVLAAKRSGGREMFMGCRLHVTANQPLGGFDYTD